MSQDQTTSPAPAARRSWIVPALVAIILLLVTGGAGAAWWVVQRSALSTERPVEPALVGFEPFLVNVSGSGSNRFLRISLRLLVNGAAQASRIDLDEVAKTRMRSAVLELLAAQRAETLTTPEGKATLKHDIVERAGRVVDGIEVLDVLFTEFVVQY